MQSATCMRVERLHDARKQELCCNACNRELERGIHATHRARTIARADTIEYAHAQFANHWRLSKWPRASDLQADKSKRATGSAVAPRHEIEWRRNPACTRDTRTVCEPLALLVRRSNQHPLSLEVVEGTVVCLGERVWGWPVSSAAWTCNRQLRKLHAKSVSTIRGEISMHARAHERTHPPRTLTMSPVIVRRGSTLLMTPVRAPAQQLVARERKVATSIAVTGAILFSTQLHVDHSLHHHCLDTFGRLTQTSPCANCVGELALKRATNSKNVLVLAILCTRACNQLQVSRLHARTKLCTRPTYYLLTVGVHK
jgi:hypothetical protein